MAAKADGIKNIVLNHVLGGAASTPPTGPFQLALSSTPPNSDGTNVTEPGEASYGRATGVTFTAAAGGSSSNVADAEFPVATEDWNTGGNLTHVVVYDAAGTTMVYFGALTTPTPVLSGETAKFNATALVVSED